MKKTTGYLFLTYTKNILKDILFEELSVSGQIIKGDGTQKAADYNLLILDGNSYSPEELTGLAEHAIDALSNDIPVLLLGSSGAHKKVLGSKGVLGNYSQKDSMALFIEPCYDAHGTRRIALAEQSIANSGKVEMIRTSGRFNKENSFIPEETVEFEIPAYIPSILDYAKFLNRVRNSVEALASGIKLPLFNGATQSSAPNLPPANIPTGLYNVTPVTMFWTWHLVAGEYRGYYPPEGTVHIEGLVTIGVYYDNISFNTPVQWLIIEHTGSLTGDIVANDNDHIGWSIGALGIEGQNFSSGTLVNHHSSPNNENGQTTYTSGSEFSVGITAGTDGLSANANYTISSSQTNTISDWKILQRSPNSWLFSQSLPYDGATPPGQFPSGCGNEDGVAKLPAISMGSLAFDTQSVYVQSPASTNLFDVNYNLGTYPRFTYTGSFETGDDTFVCSWNLSTVVSEPYLINFASVWPS